MWTNWPLAECYSRILHVPWMQGKQMVYVEKYVGKLDALDS